MSAESTVLVSASRTANAALRTPLMAPLVVVEAKPLLPSIMRSVAKIETVLFTENDQTSSAEAMRSPSPNGWPPPIAPMSATSSVGISLLAPGRLPALSAKILSNVAVSAPPNADAAASAVKAILLIMTDASYSQDGTAFDARQMGLKNLFLFNP